MKTTMKRSIVYLLAVLLVFQIVPAFANQYSGSYTPGFVIFREKLEITSSGNGAIMAVGSTVQLGYTDGYDDIVWSSDNPEVATVEGGLVTAIAAGQVKITVTAENGNYSDSITFRIMGASAPEESEKNAEEKLVIIVSGAKTKVEYDGDEHVNTYSVSCSNEELYDANKLHVAEEGLASGLECWTYQDNLTATYDDENAEVVVSNGWLQIKPAAITVKADDVTLVNNEETPAFTVTVTSGLVEGEEIDLSGIEFTTLEQNGTTYILPNIQKGQVFGNYKVSKVESGKMTAVSMVEMPLYNLAHFEGSKDYYRLAKTSIQTTVSNITKRFGTVMKPEEYRTEAYDFDDLKVKDSKGREFVYYCEKNAETIANGANYYTVSLDGIEIIRQKIGGMNGSNPRWMVPEDQRYNDPNATDSIHRNYTIKTFMNKSVYVEQDLFNMLTLTGNGNFYRLRKTTIKAVDASTRVHGKVVDPAEYYLQEYDFTNLVLSFNGVDYRYSVHEMEGEYESYYTIKLLNVMKEDKVNNMQDWYENPEGFLDGSASDYEGQPNKVQGYHANYRAYLHEGTIANKRVTISSDWPEGELGHVGTMITLTSHLTGFEEGSYYLQWQYTTDGITWVDQEGANGEALTYELNEITTHYSWRVVVFDK